MNGLQWEKQTGGWLLSNQDLALVEVLTKRQLQVLKLVASGLSNREIAKALSVAESTVENHMVEVRSKLGVTSRTQAAVIWTQYTLLSTKHRGFPSGKGKL